LKNLAPEDRGLTKDLHTFLTSNDKRSITHKKNSHVFNRKHEARQRPAGLLPQKKRQGKFVKDTNKKSKINSIPEANDRGKLHQLIPVKFDEIWYRSSYKAHTQPTILAKSDSAPSFCPTPTLPLLEPNARWKSKNQL
jgi:hypothetical protein